MNTDGMVQIPAGTLHHKDSPESAVELVQMPAFAIGIYPVTVAEYAAFVEDGYDDPALWSAPGWAWRLEHDVEAPRFWGEEEWTPYLEPTHPVVGVSAYEAEAYASFVGLRLPTEREWERACRGDDSLAEVILSGGDPTGSITFQVFAANDSMCTTPLTAQDPVEIDGVGSYPSEIFTADRTVAAWLTLYRHTLGDA